MVNYSTRKNSKSENRRKQLVIQLAVALGTIAMAVGTFGIILQNYRESHLVNRSYINIRFDTIPSLVPTNLASGISIGLENTGRTMAKDVRFSVYCYTINQGRYIFVDKPIGILAPNWPDVHNTKIVKNQDRNLLQFIKDHCNDSILRIEISYKTYYDEYMGYTMSVVFFDDGSLGRQSIEEYRYSSGKYPWMAKIPNWLLILILFIIYLHIRFFVERLDRMFFS